MGKKAASIVFLFLFFAVPSPAMGDAGEWVARDGAPQADRPALGKPSASASPDDDKNGSPGPMTPEEKANLRRELGALERDQHQGQSFDQVAAVVIGSLAVMAEVINEIDRQESRRNGRTYYRDSYNGYPRNPPRSHPVDIAAGLLFEALDEAVNSNRYSPPGRRY